MRARARAMTSSVWSAESTSPRADPFPGAAFSASSSTSSASLVPGPKGPPSTPPPLPFASTPRSALTPFLAPAESALGLCVQTCARTATASDMMVMQPMNVQGSVVHESGEYEGVNQVEMSELPSYEQFMG